MLPVLDEQAIAYKKRLDALRKERDEKRLQAERDAKMAQEGYQQPARSFDFSSLNKNNSASSQDKSLNFSSGSNSSFLNNIHHENAAPAKPAAQSSSGFFEFSVSGGHRRKPGDSTATKRHRADSNVVASNLQRDVFDHSNVMKMDIFQNNSGMFENSSPMFETGSSMFET